MRFPVLEGTLEAFKSGGPPKYLTCELEADHGGRHYDKHAGWWEFVPFAQPPADHVNCRCELVTIDAGVRLPPWWVAERLDEVFGNTAPRIFHPLEL